jgi:hypothetical protein
MKFKETKIAAILAVMFVMVVISRSAFAVDLTVPHTFYPGTTAKSSEINENFAAIYSELNALRKQIGTSTNTNLKFTYNATTVTFVGSSFLTGNVVLGGIPFSIPASGNNLWNSDDVSGQWPHILEISAGIYGATDVYTLINTAWGQKGPNSWASIDFIGSGGATYHADLIGNVDIRDYNQHIWTNSINGTSTINVFDNGTGQRFDMQRFVLPQQFKTQTLNSIRLTDSGGHEFQAIVLTGVTVIKTQ